MQLSSHSTPSLSMYSSVGDCSVRSLSTKLLANGTCQIALCKILVLIFAPGPLRLSQKSVAEACRNFFISMGSPPPFLSLSVSLYSPCRRINEIDRRCSCIIFLVNHGVLSSPLVSVFLLEWLFVCPRHKDDDLSATLSLLSFCIKFHSIEL